ncbi:MAG: S-layer homology domain-containing protein [Clostridiales bacterium]|jgi:hypothetical protein|nr:S-layer homology domain-containing protein [Clostridiales bacterium]
MKSEKRFKKKTRLTALALLVAMVLPAVFPAAVYAATYRDVPPTHYAFAAVDWVSNPVNGSIMVGDAANNFNPTKVLDKFEAAKIYAMAAGFKYSTATIAAAEQEIFDRSYESNRAFLDSMAGQYVRWNKTADREIAYLLYQGILTTSDVTRFITKSNNVETINNLTKQEAIVYVVRLDKKQSVADAITVPYHSPFKDDAQINADYKKYVYYAKEAGIATGSDGYFNPARNITRAEMAQTFYSMLSNRPGSSTYSPGAVSTNGSAIYGTIDSVYMDTHVYIASTSDNVPRIYKFAPNAVILVDNVQRAPAFLVRGMYATALVNTSGEIINLVAQTNAPVTPTPAPNGVLPSNLLENEGYVTAVSPLSGGIVTIKTQRVRLTGEIVTDENAYAVVANCVIKRGENVVTFNDIKVNDIIFFQYNGNTIYNIELQEKNRTIFGTLSEKKFVDLTSTPVLVIEDDKRVKYELRVSSSTIINRNGSRNLTWDELKIGDAIEADCEYDTLVAVYATGERTTVNSAVLEEIHITQNTQQIAVRRSDRSLTVHTVTPDTYDVHDLRIGMELRLYMDSQEVYDILVLSGETANNNSNQPQTNILTVYGKILSINNSYSFVVSDFDRNNAQYTVYLSANTINVDTNRQINLEVLKPGANVYITFTANDSFEAKMIKVLS